MRWDLIIALGIFFSANSDKVLRWRASITTPNFPSPRFLPIINYSTESLIGLFFTSISSINLLGGERESELFVDVGDPTFLNLS